MEKKFNQFDIGKQHGHGQIKRATSCEVALSKRLVGWGSLNLNFKLLILMIFNNYLFMSMVLLMVLTIKPPLLKRHIQNIPLPYNLHKMRVQIPWHLTHIEVLVKPAADGYLPKASSLVLGFPSLLYADNQCHGRILKASQCGWFSTPFGIIMMLAVSGSPPARQ
ncbi:hypothetical protein ACEUA6_08225 [Aeromonas veronii]